MDTRVDTPRPHAAMDGGWTVQDLGEARPGLYPEWKRYAIRSKANVCLAEVGHVDGYHAAEYANVARLIAAAPDLLAACEAMVAHYDAKDPDGRDWTQYVPALRSALSRARGEGGAK